MTKVKTQITKIRKRATKIFHKLDLLTDKHIKIQYHDQVKLMLSFHFSRNMGTRLSKKVKKRTVSLLIQTVNININVTGYKAHKTLHKNCNMCIPLTYM